MWKTFNSCLALISLLFLIAPTLVQASFIDDLKSKVLDRSQEIKKLEQEINLFQTELTKTRVQAGSLQGEIKKIDSTRKELSSNLAKTDQGIKTTANRITTLNSEITDALNNIERDRAALAEAMRSLRETDDTDILDIMLEANTLSDIASQTSQLDALSVRVMRSINTLKVARETLEGKKQLAESEKQELANLKSKLADEKQLVDQTKAEKDRLLEQTKSRESNYQKLVADRVAKKRQVEAEIANIEAQIKIAIDPTKLPTIGSSALIWPLDKVIITQYFGNTEFSRTTQAYNGKGHNGIDLGTPTGTTLKAAASGQVIGTGNTDTACAGASYGKWILLQHPNGLSTLYAHLSLIKVQQGDSVATGDLIGYTGNTGYSTGPHLHFSVFASQGVKVDRLQSKVAGCGVYTLPIASYNSYLNPLSYLPPKP